MIVAIPRGETRQKSAVSSGLRARSQAASRKSVSSSPVPGRSRIAPGRRGGRAGRTCSSPNGTGSALRRPCGAGVREVGVFQDLRPDMFEAVGQRVVTPRQIGGDGARGTRAWKAPGRLVPGEQALGIVGGAGPSHRSSPPACPATLRGPGARSGGSGATSPAECQSLALRRRHADALSGGQRACLRM